jgi:hypothetical protein
MKHPVTCRQLAIITTLACTFSTPWSAHSQETIALVTPAAPADDTSFYLGKPVAHPEELSGLWEVPDGHGGAVGIHLILSTTVTADGTTLVGVEQAWHNLQLGIYQRAGSVLQFGEENFFGDSPRGGSVRYDNGRLSLHDKEFDLDLLRISGDRWSGRIHRLGFDSTTILTRPGAGTAKSKPWFVGTWQAGDQSVQSCLHITQQAPGEFVGWTDSLNTLGSARCPSRLPKPPNFYERYGDLLKIRIVNSSNAATDSSNVSIERNAPGEMCCSYPFIVTPGDNGTVMKEVWPSESNQPPPQTVWKKMSGNTCIVAPPEPAPLPGNPECPCPEK